MRFIRQNLGSREEAVKFNQRIYDYQIKAQKEGYHPGCVSERACENCYHVIGDSVCLCVGFPKECPNCHNIKEDIKYKTTIEVSIKNFINI